ncbi:HD-GYP domain-containing protein [Litchfieldia alkalitelluris]|uniref:HD-GYP domain-containing protein n=1 Tax=Litchfieldia alkalitelluris TaxID=304268 RepID=UPI001F24A07A|nr:HD-GYP domain-containing protein [Litchfieldia alkalitelluris]
MKTLHTFKKQLLYNYIIGSFIAICGVGGIFIFLTLELTFAELIYMILIIIISLTIMLLVEYIKFQNDLKPIINIYNKTNCDYKEYQEIFYYIHRYPFITFKRVIGPHFLGLSIPAIILSYFLIKIELLSIPYHYILLALIGAILVAGMHAMIELFLTIKAIQPLLLDIEVKVQRELNRPISLQGKTIISIKRKFQLSFIYITAFPILLFSLATQVRLDIVSDNRIQYWNWAIFIILLALTFAYFGAKLLYLNLNQPINQLQHAMKNVQLGKLNKTEEIYSDEFSTLVNGFNHMIDAIVERDKKNILLFEGFLESLSTALDARDPYTAGHSIRVADYAVAIGHKLGINDKGLEILKKSALIHDIGKIGISDKVLLKDGKLSDEEFTMIKSHPEIGARILSQMQDFSNLETIIEGVLYHHERYDGFGYPKGVSGEQIPLFGRIIAVADAYDAMTSDRPYRKGMSSEKALQILLSGKGTQWDPLITDIFIGTIKKRVLQKGLA